MRRASAVIAVPTVLIVTWAAGSVSAGATAAPVVTGRSTPAVLTGGPVGTAAQQTHPAALPRRGARRTSFSVRFTLADAPGPRGVIATAYRVQVDPPSASRAACAAPGPSLVDRGTQGTSAAVGLAPPRYGWCRGSYTVRVLLQRGPYCPEPQDGQPPQPCPLFASQEIPVGTTRFTVSPVTTKGDAHAAVRPADLPPEARVRSVS